MAKRNSGVSLLSGSEIQAIVKQHVSHIDRTMSARLESYRQAFAEASQTPTDDDFNTILTRHSAHVSKRRRIRLLLSATSLRPEAGHTFPLVHRRLLLVA